MTSQPKSQIWRQLQFMVRGTAKLCSINFRIEHRTFFLFRTVTVTYLWPRSIMHFLMTQNKFLLIIRGETPQRQEFKSAHKCKPINSEKLWS